MSIITQVHESVVTVAHPGHGVFTVDESRFQQMVVNYFGDVNKSWRALAAFISKSTGVNYFDCDEITLLAVANNVVMEWRDLANFMALVEDEEIQVIFDRVENY